MKWSSFNRLSQKFLWRLAQLVDLQQPPPLPIRGRGCWHQTTSDVSFSSEDKRLTLWEPLPDHIELIEVAGSSSLLFECGDLPADAAVLAVGHEPNGYFWEEVLQYLAAGLLTQVELDPEAGMFCAMGDRVMLGQPREELEEYLDAPERISRLIREAEASGFQFDD